MKHKQRRLMVAYHGLMDDLNLDLENTYLGFAIYHSIRSDSPYYNITKDELALGIRQSMRTLYRRIKKMKEKGLIENETGSTGWNTSELWNKVFESYRDEIHPDGYGDIDEANAEEIYIHTYDITIH